MTATLPDNPSTPDELAACLDDPAWRLSHLYKVITKHDEDDGDGLVVQFKPNRAQRRLLNRVWHRNLILKARQLGFTTLACILWLDTALFSRSPIRCGIIAQDRETAESLFRDKVLFAYENLPDALKDAMPIKTCNKSEVVFAHNGSSIRVATSVRGGTIHRLHVSEMGKIGAKYPDKAREIVTGSIPAVPHSGILIIESTAEGQDGEFYKISKRAEDLSLSGRALSKKDYRFHFFPWWEEDGYELDPDEIEFTEAELDYFNRVEADIGRDLSDRKRAWYVVTLRSDFSGDAPKMWQEYPSTPKEAFQVSTEGCYYASQIATARKQGRVVQRIPFTAVAVNTFWDIGRGDMTSIWFHQRIGMEDRFIRYYEESGEDLNHFTGYLMSHGYSFGTHYLPHDADHRRMGESPDTNKTIKEMLQNLMPGHRFEVVPRISNIASGIQATRSAFASAIFDETDAGAGLARLSNYRKKWDPSRGCWRDEPLHDENSHGADAFRQWAQAAMNGATFGSGQIASARKEFRRRGSPMSV